VTGLQVGDKVTVAVSNFDPPHLHCHPCTFVVEIQDGSRGPLYWVGHKAAGNFQATRFGPFPAKRLKAGW
jgi:hypothetical protein